MTSPEESIEKYITPQEITFDMGEGLFPMNMTMHNPNLISSWRADQYLAAVDLALAENDTAPEELVRNLRTGSHWAANRASSYSPYGVYGPGFGRDTGNALTPQESGVLWLIGPEKFLAIHTMAPPAALIDYMLTGGTDPLVRPNLDQITVAVIKGQLTWEERFAAAGVPDPETYAQDMVEMESKEMKRMAKREAEIQARTERNVRSDRLWNRVIIGACAVGLVSAPIAIAGDSHAISHRKAVIRSEVSANGHPSTKSETILKNDEQMRDFVMVIGGVDLIFASGIIVSAVRRRRGQAVMQKLAEAQ